MPEHTATVRWKLAEGDFLKGKYSRHHEWEFDGGHVVPASPAPAVVPPPLSDPADVDPEEAYVASLSSCHMLTFLFLAGRAGFAVDAYTDEAVGTMAKGENRVPWVAKVTLHPQVQYREGNAPSAEEEQKLHHHAHEQCYIANSVKTEIVVA